MSRKYNYEKQRLFKKREKKRLKRKRKKRLYRNNPNSLANRLSIFRAKTDIRILYNQWYRDPLYSFLVDNGLVNAEYPDDYIIIPKDFRLTGNSYNQTMIALSDIVGSIFTYDIKNTTLDFSQCQLTDSATLFLLQVLRLEFQNRARTFNRYLTQLKVSTDVTVKISSNSEVNRLMFLAGLLPEVSIDPAEGMEPISTTGYLTGSKQQKHYHENRKGKVTTQIVNYVNECLEAHNCVLTSDGRNDMDGMIAELLNNAEDHSPFNNWYISANFCRRIDPNNNDVIGEFNLAVLNFGYSFYEGLQATAEENHEIYDPLNKHVTNLIQKYPYKHCTRENLFTLAALQENISRLRYKQESRGYGAMKFIRSMFDIGDYEDVSKHFSPKLTLFTGTTQLICDNSYKPYNKDDVYYVSLNPQNDLMFPPEPTHLQSLKYRFPGTLLSVKLFLNEQHLIAKLNGNGNEHTTD
jgi:NADPH-dependent 7-cyano-7-deazaguanine reductase QueF-like protein